MRLPMFAALAAATLMLAAAPPAKSPEETWRAELVEANTAWSRLPHAILKIQDAAYLGDGQSATLTGTKGNPATYKWTAGKQQDGILWVTYRAGTMSGAMHGKAIDDATFKKGIPIDIDVDIQGFPTQVSAGVMGVRVMLYNQLRPEALAFKGVDYFAYDPSYRIAATFKPDPKLPPRVFRTSRGTDKQFFHAGDATFTLHGKSFSLPFYADGNDPKKITELSSFFVDGLTGKGTYGAGRYVDIAGFGAFPPKTATIDFNEAYNPNCSRSAFYTCPVATDEIAMDVRAGEKDPHAH
jgi:uncharacterized protein (DUF1684 family)